MNITIIGTGYVGLVNGACMAYRGANVTCVDIDSEKIARLNNGEIPIYEDSLEKIVKYGIKRGRISFSTDYSSINTSTITFICVGTPEGNNGSADLTYVFSAVKSFIENINPEHECVLVIKSTVPVGTTDRIKYMVDSRLGINHKVHIAFNPEFLKEGFAVSDCLNPDRVVIGFEDDRRDEQTFEYSEMVSKLYGRHMRFKEDIIVTTDICSAEMVKYASNAMLATRISFMNEIANLCEAVGANFDDVKTCVGRDTRIGPHFLRAGCGYGGSCFPKDVRALMKTADENHTNMFVLNAVDRANEAQKSVLYHKYVEYFNEQRAAKACVLGLAFKPGTDDMREASSINLINDLLGEGVKVAVCDPIACENARKIFGDEVEYYTDPYEAVDGASVVFLVTEWDEFKNIDLKKVKELMLGDVFIDGRCIFSRKEMEKLGFKFDRIG